MKRLIRYFALTSMLLVTFTARAQVFLMDDDLENTPRKGAPSGFFVPVPDPGSDSDQYLPISEGVLVLAALGGAYLIGKRRKKKVG